MVKNFSLYDLFPDIGMVNILDVGAMSLGQGTEPYAPLVNANRATVTGFEPDAAECEKLNQEAGDNHTYHPHFIGNGGKATYYQTNHAMTGSLYKPNAALMGKFQNMLELSRLETTYEVETLRLDDIEDMADIDLIKIDVQGAELDVFKGAGRVLADTVMIIAEVEFVALYEDQPMFADVDGFLRGAGFQFHTFLGFGGRCFKPVLINNNPNQGMRQLLWSDAVYVRDFMNLEPVSGDKLFRLSALLHDMLNSLDLCQYVLNEIDQREGSSHAQTYMNALGN